MHNLHHGKLVNLQVCASPSANAVLAAIRASTGPAGCLLLVMNYTGRQPTQHVHITTYKTRILLCVTVEAIATACSCMTKTLSEPARRLM